ncbi:MAG: FHA domain-containing protein [Kiritimatiellia bacterium]
MSTEEKVVCPHCGRKTDPGNFCQRCIKALDAPVETPTVRSPDAVSDATGQTRVEDATGALRTAVGSDAVRRFQHVAELTPIATPAATPVRVFENKLAPAASVRPVAPVMPVAPVSPVITANSPAYGGSLVEILYNPKRVFVVGLAFPLQFMVRAIDPTIERVVFCFRGKVASNVLPADEEVEFNDQDLLPSNFVLIPKCAGLISIQVYIGLKRRQDADWLWQRAVVNHSIYPEPISALQGLQSLTIDRRKDIKIEGQADRAGDNRIHVDASDGAHDLFPTNHNSEVQKLIDTLAAKEDFEPLPMYTTKGPIPTPQIAVEALPPPPSEARVEHLTLERGGRALHLCGKAVVAYGRKREKNDLVLRCYDASGTVDTERTGKISRYHGEIGFGEEGAWISDSPFDYDQHSRRRSANGIALDGRPIPPGGKIDLRHGQSVRLEIANNSSGGAPLTLAGTVAGCPKNAHCPASHACHPGLTAGVLLRRSDHVPEDYALVWRCLPLDTVFTDLTGARVYRCHDAFMLQMPGCAPCWLCPGTAIPTPQGALQVGPFKQKYL